VTVITCSDCHRTFADQHAFDLHFFFDVKSNMVLGVEDAAIRFNERRRCGNDGELSGRGVKYMGYPSVSGRKDDYWVVTE
jgi:hypothetical protein